MTKTPNTQILDAAAHLQIMASEVGKVTAHAAPAHMVDRAIDGASRAMAVAARLLDSIGNYDPTTDDGTQLGEILGAAWGLTEYLPETVIGCAVDAQVVPE
jgi:type VI protein secretion system component VasF